MNDSCYPGDCELTQALLKKARQRSVNDKRTYAWQACFDRASKIKLLLLDVDGVLTDGSLTYLDDGTELKSFHARDGFGITLVQRAGIKTGIITARQSGAVAKRAKNLSITYLYQGIRNKIEAYQQILSEENLEDKDVAYIGDDWLDLPMLSRVGFAIAVADAAEEVRNVAHYTTQLPGGHGAVREACNLLVEARGLHNDFLRHYITGTRNDL